MLNEPLRYLQNCMAIYRLRERESDRVVSTKLDVDVIDTVTEEGDDERDTQGEIESVDPERRLCHGQSLSSKPCNKSYCCTN